VVSGEREKVVSDAVVPKPKKVHANRKFLEVVVGTGDERRVSFVRQGVSIPNFSRRAFGIVA